MHSRLLLLPIFAVLLVTQRAVADDEIKWGQPINGLRLGVSSPVASVDTNQNPTFTIIVQNVSSHPITIPTWDTFLLKANPDSDDYHEMPLRPSIQDAKPDSTAGLGYPSPTYSVGDTGQSVGTCLDHVQTLPAGESAVWNAMPLDQNSYKGDHLPPNEKTTVQHWQLLPGRQYDIQFQFANEQLKVAKTEVWTGTALSGPIRIQVNMPSRDGIKLEGHFSLAKQRYFIGEPIEVTFTVANAGTSVIAYQYGGDYRSTGRPDRFTITAIDSNGKVVPDPVNAGGMGGGLGSCVMLKPGESHEDKLIANHWRAFTAPGTYSITCKRTLNVIPNADTATNFYSLPEIVYPAFPIENTFQVTLEDDPTALKSYLEKIAPRWQHQPAPIMEPAVYEEFTCLALAQNDIAFPVIVSFLDGSPQVQELGAQWLCLYPPDKFVPVFTEHFPKMSSQAQQAVLAHLGEAHSPLAESLIVFSLQSKDVQLRALAAQVCTWGNTYPNCVPILLNMQSDPDLQVRRYVAGALGVSGDKRAVPVLLKLLHDPDLETRVWAAGGLGKFKRMDGVAVMIDLLQNPKMRDYEGNIMDCLHGLTGKDFGDNHSAWLEWWEKTGHAKYQAEPVP